MLQMYGEKAEEVEELKLDIDDLKTMYRQQVKKLFVQWNPLFWTPLGQLKGGVLISGVVIYTYLCNWDHAWCPDSRRCPHFRGVLIEGF